MKHTREQLDGMSDFKLNIALCQLAGYELADTKIDDFGELECLTGNRCASSVCVKSKDDIQGSFEFFSFNDLSILMPLAFEYGICLISPQSHTKTWSARWTDGGGLWSVSDIKYSNVSPQRAIACCLIMVLESKND